MTNTTNTTNTNPYTGKPNDNYKPDPPNYQAIKASMTPHDYQAWLSQYQAGKKSLIK